MTTPQLPATGRRASPRRRSVAGSFLSRLLLLIALIAIAGCTPATGDGDPAAGDEAVAVAIVRFEYEPRTVTVPVGTIVRWTNEDRFGHTVTSGEPREPDGTFDGELGETIDGRGEMFTHTFDEPGTYPYHCAFHPRMTGTVVVESG